MVVNAISLNAVPVSTQDRNITSLLQWEPDVKLHEFQTVEGALSCVNDPDVMNHLSFVAYDTVPQGDYIFFPFQLSDTPCGPCFLFDSSSQTEASIACTFALPEHGIHTGPPRQFSRLAPTAPWTSPRGWSSPTPQQRSPEPGRQAMPWMWSRRGR